MQLDTLDANTTFYWRARASNDKGTSFYSDIASFTTGDEPSGVDETERIPTKFVLAQNYPNPFNPSTTIYYEIPKNSYVKIIIYDVLGRVTAILADGVQPANKYSIKWSPFNLNSGVYLCKILARSQDGLDNFVSAKKLLFIK